MDDNENNDDFIAPLSAYVSIAAAVTTSIIVTYVEAPFFLGMFILVVGIAVIPLFILLFMRRGGGKERDDY